MAKPAAPSINEKVEKEANDRLKDCRREKAQWDEDYREALFFATPNRSRVIASAQQNSVRPKDAGECNISLASEVAQDFATLILNTFLPETEIWAKREPGPDMPDAVATQAQPIIDAQDATIFKAIKASNFYPEVAKGFVPDLAMGVAAIWIEDFRPSEPLMCMAVPIHELEIGLGPFGDLDTRFHVRHTKWRFVKALLGKGVTLPDDLEKLCQDKPDDKIELRRGFWRLWDEAGDVTYQYVVMIEKRLVKEATIKGRGSVPLIVGRFNPMTEWAWAPGPLVKSMPDLRSYDQLTIDKFEALEFGLRPPVSYPDDSVMNLEEGIESGMAYAIRPGTEDAIKAIYEPNPPNAAIYEVQDLRQNIKRAFFLDFPEQRGDTPPSATQWLDETTKAQRRIGTPGLPFWREFAGGVFERFQYLLQKRGTIKPIEVDGRQVSLVAYNPAQRAAEQQEIAQAAKAIEICGPAFPEEWKLAVDGTKTIANIVKLIGASKVVVMRSPADIQAAIDNIQKLQAGQPGTAPQMGGASAAPPQDAGGVAPAPAQLISRGA